MSAVRISDKDISIGNTLPWSVYDDKGVLLLQKGSMVTNAHQLTILLERGMYREEIKEPVNDSPKKEPAINKSSPFAIFDELAQQLSEIFSRLVLEKKVSYEEIEDYCKNFVTLCRKDPDAALGIVHLHHAHPYTIRHPLHGAILCELISKHIGYNLEQRIPIIAAALLGNIGMLDLQEILHHQSTPLTNDQRERIDNHTEESVRIIKAAGINDPQLRVIIRQHHERIDGSGYPEQLNRSVITEGAQVVAIADRYAAMVSPRSYRVSIRSRDALKEFFLQKDKSYNARLSLSLIKELGVFPPGTYVSLKNGETAVVVKRGKKSMWPMAVSVLNPDGAHIDKPVHRDCNNEIYAIHDVISMSAPLSLNLHTLWGYN